MSVPKEQVYDEQIFPLMSQIIEICKTNKIAMIADFALDWSEDDQCELKCTTTLLGDEYDPPREMLLALEHLKPKRPMVAAFTVTRETP